MMCRKFLFSAILAGIAMAGLAPPARADLFIVWSETGGSSGVYDLTTGMANLTNSGANASGGLSGATSFTTNNFSVTVVGGNADQLGPTELLGGAFTVKDTNTNTAATNTITITLWATGYNAPVVPPPAVLSSSITGTITNGNVLNTLSYQSYVNTATNGSFTGSTPGSQTANIVGNGTTSTPFNSGSASTVVNSLGTPFELVQTISFTMGGKSALNYSDSTTLVSTPEPMSMVLVMSGLPALYLIRRRARAQA